MSLTVGIVLTGAKFAAYFLTGSTAVFSDALESIVNVLAAGFAAYSLHVAHTPADESHPYGHGKIEFLSSGFEGGMILLAALAAAIKAVSDLLHRPTVSEKLDVGIALMCGALIANGAMGMYLVRTGRQQKSPTLEADGHHLLTDAITSVVAAVALVIVRFTHWPYADPIGALLVSAYIARTGVRLMGHAGAGLMDRQDRQDEQLLQGILRSHLPGGSVEPTICSYHKVRHRHSGRYHWVDFHLVVPADWSIERGHATASAIEKEIERALGEGDATAHVEPCIRGECTRCPPKMGVAG